MAIPIARKFYRAILEIADERRDVWGYNQMIDALTIHFSLTEDDLQEMVPSGGVTRVRDRTNWAVGDLERAGFLTKPTRGRFQINNEGHEYLRTLKGDVTAEQQKELKAMNRNLQDVSEDSDSVALVKHVASDDKDSETTPSERIATAYTELQAQLVDEILDSLSSIDPRQFEQLVVDLLEKMGYGEGQQVGGSRDGGIDSIINQDPLGLEKIYVQAKRWQNAVGEPEIRNFSGSLAAKGAAKGVFTTTSTFSPTALQTARIISGNNQVIHLINGAKLACLMIKYNVGVIPTTLTYAIKKLDENYFAEDL